MPIEIWHQDEARVGQQGTLTYIWAEKGSRPAALRDLRYEWAYLFGAVCAERGVGAALVLPHANTKAMNLHLVEISVSLRREPPGRESTTTLSCYFRCRLRCVDGWRGGDHHRA